MPPHCSCSETKTIEPWALDGVVKERVRDALQKAIDEIKGMYADDVWCPATINHCMTTIYYIKEKYKDKDNDRQD